MREIVQTQKNADGLINLFGEIFGKRLSYFLQKANRYEPSAEQKARWAAMDKEDREFNRTHPRG